MRWEPLLNDLVDLFAGVYRDAGSATVAVRKAGLSPENIDISGRPKVMWMRILEEANLQGRVPELVRVVAEEYPNLDIPALTRRAGSPTAVGPKLGETDWKGAAFKGGSLERITGAQSTFLPISFLETGILRARAVCQVITPGGLGTGFLIEGNLLITNNHVIPDASRARASRVAFNYQKTTDGLDARIEEYRLDPEAVFATSSAESGDDWTAVRIAGRPDEVWGAIPLDPRADIAVEGFVNVVQHSAGRPKEIALYHNVVVYRDETRVQYLTDTLPGSSGSPVFDSTWRVVALHHSGGWLAEPGTDRLYFRNEGIHVRCLIQGLREAGVLSPACGEPAGR